MRAPAPSGAGAVRDSESPRALTQWALCGLPEPVVLPDARRHRGRRAQWSRARHDHTPRRPAGLALTHRQSRQQCPPHRAPSLTICRAALTYRSGAAGTATRRSTARDSVAWHCVAAERRRSRSQNPQHSQQHVRPSRPPAACMPSPRPREASHRHQPPTDRAIMVKGQMGESHPCAHTWAHEYVRSRSEEAERTQTARNAACARQSGLH